jgi:hypothetical protein
MLEDDEAASIALAAPNEASGRDEDRRAGDRRAIAGFNRNANVDILLVVVIVCSRNGKGAEHESNDGNDDARGASTRE